MKSLSDLVALWVGMLIVASGFIGVSNVTDERQYNRDVGTRANLQVGEVVAIGPCYLVFPVCPYKHCAFFKLS